MPRSGRDVTEAVCRRAVGMMLQGPMDHPGLRGVCPLQRCGRLRTLLQRLMGAPKHVRGLGAERRRAAQQINHRPVLAANKTGLRFHNRPVGGVLRPGSRGRHAQQARKA